VKWVLDAPRRVRHLVREGRREEAEKEWDVVSRLLGKWEGVKGVEDVRREGEDALKGG
jgi:vacuolar protein sorting-associated protein 51